MFETALRRRQPVHMQTSGEELKIEVIFCKYDCVLEAIKTTVAINYTYFQDYDSGKMVIVCV